MMLSYSLTQVTLWYGKYFTLIHDSPTSPWRRYPEDEWLYGRYVSVTILPRVCWKFKMYRDFFDGPLNALYCGFFSISWNF